MHVDLGQVRSLAFRVAALVHATVPASLMNACALRPILLDFAGPL